MVIRNPLGGLLSTAFTLGLLALLWFTVGHSLVDDIKADTERQGGGGPASDRIVNADNFRPHRRGASRQGRS